MASGPSDYGRSVENLREQVNDALAHNIDLDHPPASLYDATRYVLAGSGKRLRPILLLLTARAFGTDVERALPAALAIELFHNFTLVHDDIMDQAAERRGRATVHQRWNEATAILVGDLLLSLSYEQLEQVPTDVSGNLRTPFHATVRRLCEGQSMDLEFESEPEVSVQQYLDMIDRKTGALLRLTFELGGYIGRAAHGQVEALTEAGAHAGRAFQIRDDLLDLTADDEGWGKAIGADLRAGKKTYLLLNSLERATGAEAAWFQRIIAEGGLPGSDIPEARQRMRRLGVLDDARDAILMHTNAAQECLEVLPSNEASETLRWLIDRMRYRVR